MPRTSSAVPADLMRFARTTEAAAADCAVSATSLARAAAQLGSSRSAGLTGIDLAALGGRLRRHVDRAYWLADGVGDVAHAFALAGGATGGEASGEGSAGPKGLVAVDDRFLAACRRLPDGRPRSLAELEGMTFAQRLSWFRRLQDSALVPDDPNFRAVAGILAAAHASGPGGMWDDDAFRVADAALLDAMQLGLLAGAAGGAWRPAPSDPRARAVDAWVDYRSTIGADEPGSDATWALAEEQSVRYGEAVADERGLRFQPALEDFVRFSHVFRGAVMRGEQAALLSDIAGGLDTAGLARLADGVRDVVGGRIDDLIHIPGEGIFDWVRPFLPPVVSPFDLLNPFDSVFDAADRALRWSPLISIVPPVGVVVEALVTALSPPALAALILDPEATPPPVVASVLDDVLEVDPPMAHAPASYYVAMLVDRGYLRGLPTALPEVPSAVPRLPGE